MAFGEWDIKTDRGRPKVSAWSSDSTIGRIDLDDMVLAFNTSKTATGAFGSWSVDLAPMHSGDGLRTGRAIDMSFIRRAFRPNTVVSIGMDSPGGIMVGLVDRVEVVRNMSTEGGMGAANVTFRLSGRDLGKALVNDHIILGAVNVVNQPAFFAQITAALGPDHPLLQFMYGVNGPAIGATDDPAMTFQGATIQEAAEFILEFAATLRLPALAEVYGGFGDAGNWIDAERFVSDWNDGRVWNASLNRFQGTIWAFLQRLLDTDLWEVRLDCIPLNDPIPLGEPRLPNPVLIIRPKPYTDKVLERATVEAPPEGRRELRTLVKGKSAHEFKVTELYAVQLGFDDSQAFAHYQVTSDAAHGGNPNGHLAGLAYPLVDTYTAKRYGLRGYTASLGIVGGDIIIKDRDEEDVSGDLYTEVHDARNLLFNWYWANPIMLTGSITVAGRDEYRAGDPVYIEGESGTTPFTMPWLHGRGITAYATGVSHSWRVGGEYITKFQLARGYHDGMIEAEKAAILLDPVPPGYVET